MERQKPIRSKVQDYSKFSSDEFNNDLSQVDWDMMITNSKHDINKLFSFFDNKVNNLVNKHAPLKPVSCRRAKLLRKPWITKGLGNHLESRID